MKRQGLLSHYNGIDIIQTRDYVTLHVGLYLRKIVSNHGWNDMHRITLPMSADNEHIRSLDTAPAPSSADSVKLEGLFRYRGAIGELIWAMITCRPEISFPVTKLSQFATAPAKLHYDAVKRIFRYLNGTLDHGLTYCAALHHMLRYPVFPRLFAYKLPLTYRYHMMSLMLRRSTSLPLYLGMSIPTGLLTFVTAAPFQASSLNLLVPRSRGNVAYNPRFPSLPLKLNF
jgi:hypothetical protein